MNIFLLDKDLTRSAEYMVDSHVRKMLIEATQMLCIAVAWHHGYIVDTVDPYGKRHYSKFEQMSGVYKYTKSQASHPCTLWARTCRNNAMYLERYAYEMIAEYEHRFGKKPSLVRATLKTCMKLLREPGRLPALDKPTKFIQCMNPIYHDRSAVKAYRKYYKATKQHLLVYTKRRVPAFMKD
jgi:hypothetical protein